MSPSEAKKILKPELDRLGIVYDKLTARTRAFNGFGYGRAVFVHVHGWAGGPENVELKRIAHDHGFCVECDSVCG
jgi:hypothetical protein